MAEDASSAINLTQLTYYKSWYMLTEICTSDLEESGLEKTVGIYIHIPFCASRCKYCDFCTIAGRDLLIPEYQAALIQNIKESASRLSEYFVDTVFFGGGTPSYYGAKRLVKLFNTLKENYSVYIDAEVTAEVNPDSITYKDFKLLKKAGFNRISIGAQSANDEILKFIGRRHNFSQVESAVLMAKNAGFDNISLDLIYGLPNQTRDDWADTLNLAAALKPRHLSCYGLKIEEGTPLYEMRHSDIIPDEDAQADMYLYTVEALGRFGYFQYEISNFAKKGAESKHNIKYWKLGDYAGFGASAASNIGSLRYTYTSNPEEYIEAVESGKEIITESEKLSKYDRAAEYLMLGLRTVSGISSEEYNDIYRSNFAPIDELFQSYVEKGWAKCVYGRWSFTPKGFLISNRLISEVLDTHAEQKLAAGASWMRNDYYQNLLDGF